MKEAYAGAPPAWVQELFAPGPLPGRPEGASPAGSGGRVALLEREGMALAAARIEEAADLPAADLRREVGDLYRAIRSSLEGGPAPHPVRFWNFIPGIHDRMSDGTDRYRTFNAGRHDALTDWFPGPGAFARRLPTATGVGHAGAALIVWCLAAARPPCPTENPRQRSAWTYSARYGPLPPCFSRATIAVLRGAARLLVGGTASVRGEESLHAGSLERQLEETCRNLESLLAAAVEAWPAKSASWEGVCLCGRPSGLREARVYLRDASREGWVREAIAARLPGLRRVEFLRAEICRPELLVEIEGLA